MAVIKSKRGIYAGQDDFITILRLIKMNKDKSVFVVIYRSSKSSCNFGLNLIFL